MHNKEKIRMIENPIKRLLFFVIFFVSSFNLLSCSANSTDSSSSNLTEIFENNVFLYSLEDLQGSWELIDHHMNGQCEVEWVGPYSTGLPSVIEIKDDTLYKMEYPCQFVSREQIQIERDTLFGMNINPPDCIILPLLRSDELTGIPLAINLSGDTMCLSIGKRHSRDTYSKYYIFIKYIRKNLESNIVNVLKHDTVNPDCLIGNWKLETSFNSGYDGNGIVEYDFSFQPEPTLDVSKADLTSRFKAKNIFYLKANGKTRPFRIIQVGRKLTLTPYGNWVSGKSNSRFDDNGKWKTLYYYLSNE